MNAAQIKAAAAGGTLGLGSTGGLVLAGAPWPVIVLVALALAMLGGAPRLLQAIGQLRRDRSEAMVREAVAAVTKKAKPADLNVVALVEAALRPTGSQPPPPAAEVDGDIDTQTRPVAAPPPPRLLEPPAAP